VTAARVKLAGQVISVAAVAALLGLLVWKIAHKEGRTATPRNFSLTRLDSSGKLDLASLRGKVVVLNFWASWCEPCKQEAPRLERAWQQWRNRGVVVLGVDAQDFSTDAKRFIRRYKLTYPAVHDGPGSILGAYGVTGFPETMFIGRDGRFVGEHIAGEVDAAELRRNIELALE
jgi:cytochrome c biogenesis protein CcmG/thiol:disulfide interchange protein DsbE